MLAGWFARRYFFSKKSHSVINLIAGVSVVSVAVPVAAMIVLLSVFNGFEQLVRSMNSHFDADLTLTPREGTDVRDRIARYGRAAAASRRGGGVAGARTERAHGVPRPSRRW